MKKYILMNNDKYLLLDLPIKFNQYLYDLILKNHNYIRYKSNLSDLDECQNQCDLLNIDENLLNWCSKFIDIKQNLIFRLLKYNFNHTKLNKSLITYDIEPHYDNNHSTILFFIEKNDEIKDEFFIYPENKYIDIETCDTEGNKIYLLKKPIILEIWNKQQIKVLIINDYLIHQVNLISKCIKDTQRYVLCILTE